MRAHMGVAALRGLACSLAVAAHSVSSTRGAAARAKDAGGATGKKAATPLFKFGVLADVQYADIDDATNFAKTEFRYYRGSLEGAARAVACFDAEGVAFVAQLGDLIDGSNSGSYGAGAKWKDAPNSVQALEDVLKVLDKADADLFYVHSVGNHELYNFNNLGDLDALLSSSSCQENKHRARRGDDGPFYFSFTLDEKEEKEEGGSSSSSPWRFVVLNTFEESVMLPRGSAGCEAARATILRENPNDLLDSQGKVDYFQGLVGDKLRFVPFNGACGGAQRRWLRAELEAAEAADQRVVVLTHLPLHPRAASWRNVAFDSPDVLEVLHDFPGRVLAVLAGHCHTGGYHHDDHGIHHVTVQAVLTHKTSHGIVDVFEDHLTLRGTGALPSRDLFPTPPTEERATLKNNMDLT